MSGGVSSRASTVLTSESELSRFVEPVLVQALARLPGWSLVERAIGSRFVSFRVRSAAGDVRLGVGPIEGPQGVAHRGAVLRVWAPSPPADPRVFDALAAAVVALAPELRLAPPPEARTVRAFYHPERETRAFHLVGLGMARTGTTSLTATFCDYRAAHEHDAERLVPTLIARYRGGSSEGEVRAMLRERDARARLEVDVCTFVHLAAEDVVATFPDARFVLTWRPFLPWLASMTGMAWSLVRARSGPKITEWERSLLEVVLGEGFATLGTVTPTREDGRRFAETALAYWRRGLEDTLRHLPAGSLVIETSELASALPRLAAFVGVDPTTLVPRHENLAASKENAIAILPRAWLDEVAASTAPLEARCRALG